MRSTRDILVENILDRMAAAGLKQVQLAKLAKIDPVQLNRILNKKRGIGPKLMKKLTGALSCTESDLHIDSMAIPKEQHPPEASRDNLIAAIVTRLGSLNEAELVAISERIDRALSKVPVPDSSAL